MTNHETKLPHRKSTQDNSEWAHRQERAKRNDRIQAERRNEGGEFEFFMIDVQCKEVRQGAQHTGKTGGTYTLAWILKQPTRQQQQTNGRATAITSV